MSLRRLNAEERATYLIGEAVMRQLLNAPRDPDTQREIEAVSRWITHWLTAEEYHHVACNTGYIFDSEDAEEMMPGTARQPPATPTDDDVLF